MRNKGVPGQKKGHNHVKNGRNNEGSSEKEKEEERKKDEGEENGPLF